MFKPETLLIIGAGAGQEVGLPVGTELSGQIANKVNFLHDDIGRIVGGDPEIRRLLVQKSRGGGEAVASYYSAGRQIAQGIQFSRSIDEFINKHKDNQEIQFCAKLAIAQAIVEAERSSALFIDQTIANRDFARPSQIQNSWFMEFVRILHDGLAKSDIDKLLDRLTIINFNYDRCVEQFLFYSLQYSYGVDAQRAAQALAGAKIIHPYGHLGALPWQDSHLGLHFGGDPHGSTDILRISARIKTFYEQLQDEVDLAAIKTAVAKADRIVFLGFGFHPQNMTMLRPVESTSVRQIYGTAYGESDAGVGTITRNVRAVMGNEFINTSGQFHINRHLKCLNLLNEYSRELSAI
jgi:hypothetical protein